MTSSIRDSIRTIKKNSKNQPKFEYLSISCPRSSEFVIRTKKIGKKKEFVYRGNAVVLNEFFNILEYSAIEELKFHIVEIQPEDIQILREKLRKFSKIRAKLISFNQSADPQLIIDFSLKSENLEFLMVKGYNQKYPCNKTDYLIKVPISTDQFPASFVKKSQIPLMCQPLEWPFENRGNFLIKELPENLVNWKFIAGTQFFINQPTGYVSELVASKSSGNLLRINGSLDGIHLKFENYKINWKKIRDRLQNRFNTISPEKLHRIFGKYCFSQSDEEWDVDLKSRTLLDMPMLIIDKIIENLTFDDKVPLRSSCRQFCSLFNSRKFPFFSVRLHELGFDASIENQMLGQRFPQKSEAIETILSFGIIVFKTGNVESLNFDLKYDQFEKLLEETANFGPFPVWNLRFECCSKADLLLKFLNSKCQNPLKSIKIFYYDYKSPFLRQFQNRLLSVEKVHIESIYLEDGLKFMHAFVKKFDRKKSNPCSLLTMELSDRPYAHDKIRLKYLDRVVSDYRLEEHDMLRIRTRNPEKHILIQHNEAKLNCEVISADMDINDYKIQIFTH